MEQINYQNYEQAEGFNPVKRTDVTAGLDRRNARLAQDEQQFLQGLRRNTQTHVQNAARQGEGLEALAKFSKTLVDYLTEKEQANMEERIKAEDAAGEAAAYEQYAAGNLTVDPQYQQQTQEFDRRTDASNEIGLSLVNENPENYPAARQLRETSGQYQMGYQRAKSRIAALEFPGWMEKAMSGIDMTGMNETEREAAVSGLRSRFMTEYGLSGVNPQFLAREVYPQVIKSMSRINKQVRKEAAIEDSDRVKNEANFTLQGDRDINRYLTTMAQTVDGNGDVIGYSGAWKKFNEQVTAQVKAGLLNEGDLTYMENQPIPGDPKGRTYGQLHKLKFAQLRKNIEAVERQDFNNSEADKRRLFKETEEEILASFADDPDGVTDKQIDDFQDMFVAKFGEKSSELETYKKNSSVDAKTKEKQREMIENLISAQLLTPLELKKFHPDLQREFMSTAQQQQKQAKSTGNFKPQLAALKNAVAGKAKLTKESYGHPTVPLMEAKLEQEFLAKVAELTAAGDPNAANNAVALVLDQFNKDYDEKHYRKGFPDLLPTTSDAKTADWLAQSEMDRINDILKLSKDTADAFFFDEDQVEAMSKKAAKGDIDPMLDYIGRRYGLSGLDILNRQRRLHGMDLLPIPPAEQAVQNELTPAQQRLLRTFPTPERSQRALSGMSSFKPELLPSRAQQYVPAMESAAKKYNIPLPILAGLIETESAWDPNAANSIGARGLAQFMPGTAAERGVNVNDPTSSINGAAKYLRDIMDGKNGTGKPVDLNTALYMYNAGPYRDSYPYGHENREYLPKILKSAGKYGYGKQSLSDPAVIRPSSPVLAYVSGNIGPTSTGPHLDVKEVGGGNFAEDALDDFVEVDDPEFGRVSLGEIRKRTGGIGDNQAQHRARGSHGIDYGLHSGTKVYVKNGAKVVSTRPSVHGDVVTIKLPNGKQYTFIHGTKA